MGIEITVKKKETHSIVFASGRIDAISSDELEDNLISLLDQGETNIILNLNNVEYISSAGLRVLVVIAKQMYDSGNFCLCNSSENVLEIIEMAGFNVFMTIYDDLETAEANVNEG